MAININEIKNILRAEKEKSKKIDNSFSDSDNLLATNKEMNDVIKHKSNRLRERRLEDFCI